MNASVFVTEYGCSTHLDNQLLAPIVEQQDRQRTSSTFWIWKENGTHEPEHLTCPLPARFVSTMRRLDLSVCCGGFDLNLNVHDAICMAMAMDRWLGSVRCR
jgi:hypothetical protein